MKDLYKRIGLSGPLNDLSTIEMAINTTDDPDDAAAAKHILLNPRRKAVYDRNRNIVATIGLLRSELDLPSAPQKVRGNIYDFDYLPSKNVSSPNTSSSNNPKRYALIAGLLILGIGIPIVLESNFSSDTNNTPRTTRATRRDTPTAARKVKFSHDQLVSYLVTRGWLGTDLDEISRMAHQSQESFGLSYEEAIIKSLTPFQISMPQNGYVHRYHTTQAIAPFEVNTRHGGGNYFVKLVDWYSKAPVLTVFVRDGHRVKLEVPEGKYELRYVSCSNWYGPGRFGPDAQFSSADESFRFYVQGNQVNGNSVTLYRVRGGNLTTSTIEAGQF